MRSRETKDKGKGGEKGKRGRGGEASGYKVAFWNVAGLRSKDGEFWKGLEEWDVVVMSETWMEEGGWRKVEGRLPRGYVWDRQWARREKKRGRAMGGMLMGVRKGMEVEVGEEGGKEGILMKKIRMGGEWWRIVGVYVNGDLQKKLEDIGEWMEERERGVRVMIGGDFNARTGEEGGWVMGGDEEEGGGCGSRRSKDKEVNGDGRRLCGFIEERGWSILNGGIEGDEQGEWTFTGGKTSTVIDYVIGNEDTWEKVERLKVEERVDSDHQPLVVWVRGEMGGNVDRRKSGERGRRGGRGNWTEEGRREFVRNFGKRVGGDWSVDEEWGELKERIKGAVGKSVVKGGEMRRKEGWWDKECREEKSKVRKELRKWRREGGDGMVYRERKRGYGRLCEEKRKKEVERWERELEGVRTEAQVWKVVNRERGGRSRVNERIKIEEWNEYFRGLLGGVEWRVKWGGGRREGRDEEREIGRDEIGRVVRGLKDGKAGGSDGIQNEVWKYGGEEVEKWLWVVCNRVWRGEGWPEGWKEGIVVPVLKKGAGERVEDYRGITLTQTAYKIYASVLAERLRLEVEEKMILPPSQAGFRRGVGCVDHIYTLNYLINRQVGRKERKLIILFVDMKAAFDSVDREVLIKAMRERGVREGLVARCEEVLRETTGRVRVGEEEGDRFWTARGVRQGCPLSPILFTILIANMDEELGRGGWGGVKLGERRVYTLAYADDVAVLAEDVDGMKGIIGKLEKYVDGKGLQVNVGKTKVMRCRRGGGRWGKVIWRWKGKQIEEVHRFKYLGYTMMGSGGQEEHVKERVRKGAALLGQVWGIGKRKCGKDWGRRLWLFDKLVWAVISYGVEVWGWKCREKVEGLHERYMKWVLGVDYCTPGYMVREELQRGMMKGGAGMRAWGYERKLEEGKGGELARECWEEMKRRMRRGKVLEGWEEEREQYYKDKGWTVEEVERLRDKGELRGEELVERERRTQEEERWRKIGEGKYNKWYGRVKGVGVPGYLKKGWGEDRWRRIARFRLGNEMRGGRYWEEEEKRSCRVCGQGEETWGHVWEVCTGWGVERGWQNAMVEVLGDDGEGEEWMKRLEERRDLCGGSVGVNEGM